MYRLENFDAKTQTGSWKRVEHRYQIVSDDPKSNTVVTKMLPVTKRDILESRVIDSNSGTSHTKVMIPALKYQLDGGDDIYVDGKNLPCSEQNERWKIEGLALRSADALASSAKRVAERRALLARWSRSGLATTIESNRASGKVWSIVEVDTRVTERNGTWWRYAWKLTLRNDANQPHLFSGQIEFQDADGFIIDTDSARNMIVPPNEEKVFTGYALIRSEVAGNVARTNAKIAMER